MPSKNLAGLFRGTCAACALFLTTSFSVNASSIEVSKTSFVDGNDVCGTIRITNVGEHAAVLSDVVDSLEVHFPAKVDPPPLPAGSTPKWFKVAEVPVPHPSEIPVGETRTIDYCIQLCSTTEHVGANSMRNVVAVTVQNHPAGRNTVTTRSESFVPPVLDCQACCLSDGSCTDFVPEECLNELGQPQGMGTDCASNECPEACCAGDGTCTDEPPSDCQAEEREPQGPGTECATTECPEACCHGDGSCDERDPGLCLALGGETHGPGSKCATTQCTEACCFIAGDSLCENLFPATCEAQGGNPQGGGTECPTDATTICPAPPDLDVP